MIAITLPFFHLSLSVFGKNKHDGYWFGPYFYLLFPGFSLMLAATLSQYPQGRSRREKHIAGKGRLWAGYQHYGRPGIGWQLGWGLPLLQRLSPIHAADAVLQSIFWRTPTEVQEIHISVALKPEEKC